MPQSAETPTTPLYVRLPADAATRLDRAAFERRTSKRELVTDAVVRLLDGETTLGRAEVHRSPDPEVLTLEQAAELLQVDADTVRTLAREGTLPGRKWAASGASPGRRAALARRRHRRLTSYPVGHARHSPRRRSRARRSSAANCVAWDVLGGIVSVVA